MEEISPNTAEASPFGDEETLRVCAILEAVSSQFPVNSPESLAIRDAAMAYHVVQLDRRMKKSYESLRAACGGILTDVIKERLRRRGIEPDDFDDASTVE